MIDWLISAVAGALVAFWQYGRDALSVRFALPAALRALATALVVALLLDASAGRCDRWRLALDSAAALGGGSWLRFGDSVRADRRDNVAADRASRLRPVADRA